MVDSDEPSVCSTVERRSCRGLRRWAFLQAALCAFSGCAPREPAATTIRLLDSPGAEVEWPQDIGSPPSELTGAGIGKVPAPGRIVQLAMAPGGLGLDHRAALLAPGGSRYRFSALDLPAEPELRIALGYHASTAEGSTLEFRVVLTSARGDSVVVLRESLTTGREAAWRDASVSLAAWAGEEVSLELEIDGAPGGATIWGGWGAPEIVSLRGREAGWDVILISLDTLRADRLSCHGHHRPTSPNLDRLAAAGVRFSQAVSQAPWTRPAHRALFTGLYSLSRRGYRSTALAPVLWQAGYRTLALTGGGQLDGRFGFAEGFDAFRTLDWLRATDAAADWLDANRGRKKLVFLHTYEIHEPYDHTLFAAGLPRGRIEPGFSRRQWRRLGDEPLTDAEKAYVDALYDGGVAYTDAQLGLLLERLEASDALDRSIVVVTSDHGEQLWEHGGFGHGQSVFDHQLRVPLILHLPPDLARQLAEGRRGAAPSGRVVEQQVSLIDLYPTLLDLLDLPLPHPLQGRSLRPLLEGQRMAERFAFAEHTNVERREKKALRTGRYKLIYSYLRESADEERDERFQLFDLERDPAERVDLAIREQELRSVLEARMRAVIGGAAGEPFESAAPDDLDADLRRRLEALGYIDE